MKITGLFFFLTLCFVIPFNDSQGQGCSDAGVCTVGSFKPNSKDSISERKNQIMAGISYGFADHSIFVLGNYIAYSRMINDKFGIDAKITSLLQDGNDISAFGLSDIYLNASYNVAKRTQISLGVKIPLSDGNRMLDGLSLPMDYQSSLGTFDLLIGISYEIKKFQLVAALQQPLTQNDNGFLAERYPDTSILRSFQSTNQYQRSGDALLRLSYPFNLGRKFKLTPSLLGIYHLSNDKFTDINDALTTIEGSEGLTLNANLYADYRINDTNALQLSLGMPFIVRDARPDGLTRSYVLNLEYKYQF